MERLLTVREARTRVAMGVNKFYELLSHPTRPFPVLKFNPRFFRIREADLDRWIKRGCPLPDDLREIGRARSLREDAARTKAAEATGTASVLLRPMRLYDCRHTCATLLLESNVPMRVVQEILRHSSMKLTADTYSQVRPVVAHEAMTRMADL